MYSRKENKMAKNNDSFDMDKWSKGKTKPEKTKKEKDSFSSDEKEFKIKESSSFDLKVKKEKTPKQPKVPKAIKEDKDASFETERKSRVKPTKKIKEDSFEAFEEPKEKKKISFDLKDKKTRTIFIAVVVGVLVLAAAIAATIGIVSTIDKQNNTPVSMSMGDFPKLTYYVGEEADYTGLSVAVTKRNNQVEYIQYSEANASDFTFSGFDTSRPYDDQIIYVSYMGFGCSYHITVKEIPKADPVLTGISIETLPKTEYKVGEWIDTDGGMILKHYSDGTTARTVMVNNYICDGWEEALAGGPGTYTITIRYKENGSSYYKATYEITITE